MSSVAPMTLDNLARIGRLKAHVASKDEITDLLAAARRNLEDAHAENISAENRFDAAYKCILQAALVGLMAQGYRPDTKSAGHHATVIQSLPKTIGIDAQRVVVLDVCATSEICPTTPASRSITDRSQAACQRPSDCWKSTSTWMALHDPQLMPFKDWVTFS